MMGSISGPSSDSLMVLLGEGSKLGCPLGDTEWYDTLKRAAPVKEGAARPGECERLDERRREKKKWSITEVPESLASNLKQAAATEPDSSGS